MNLLDANENITIIRTQRAPSWAILKLNSKFERDTIAHLNYSCSPHKTSV